MANQAADNFLASSLSLYIKTVLIKIPKIAITGNAGTLKLRCKLGSLTRNNQTATHTIVKANKVPKLVMSAKVLIGVKPATKATTTPMKIVFLYGVLLVLCKSEKNFGINPSLLIPKKILDCPNIITINTEINPTVAAMVII